MKLKVLIIDDDLIIHAAIKSSADSVDGSDNIIISSASTKESALTIFEQSVMSHKFFDLIFVDLSIDERNDGFELIPVFKTHSPTSNVVVITASPQHLVSTSRALGLGVQGYIKKPIAANGGKIKEIISRAIRMKVLESEMNKLKF